MGSHKNSDAEESSSSDSDSEFDIDVGDFDFDPVGLHDGWFTHFKDKVSFFYGVWTVILTPLIMAGYSWAMPAFYSLKFPVLIWWRFRKYRKSNWHYFLFDLCYFVNAFFIAYLWLGNDNPAWFAVCFALINGPLCWAVVLFKNALVFHSTDKLTSLLIHTTPYTVTYALRWGNHLHPNWRWSTEVAPDFWHFFWLPLAFVTCHQILYAFVIRGLLGKKLAANPDALTTYRYLFRKQSGSVYRALGVLGPQHRESLFALLFIAVSAVQFLPTMLMYRYQWLHFLVGAFSLSCAIWNGASFYIEVFAARYQRTSSKAS